jgi:hypothetical protein
MWLLVEPMLSVPLADGDKVAKVEALSTSDTEPFTLLDAAMGEPLGAPPVGLGDSVGRGDGEAR